MLRRLLENVRPRSDFLLEMSFDGLCFINLIFQNYNDLFQAKVREKTKGKQKWRKTVILDGRLYVPL